MDSRTALRLIQLNQQFYQTFASQFSATRERLQPGVLKVLEMVSLHENILDLGCGNGELAHTLARGGYQGFYLGLDFSKELLDVARGGSLESPNIAFAQADLSDPQWGNSINNHLPTAENGLGSGFDIVFAFAVFHHLPSRDLHIRTLKKVHTFLTPKGRFIHSNWQFLSSPRLRARIQPWETIGLKPEQVDHGDHLMDWRRGGYGLRYVHQFSEEELQVLAMDTGFKVLEIFYSDGQEGNLGLYQIWGKA
jgi:SAM-dependent methyltransferase